MSVRSVDKQPTLITGTQDIISTNAVLQDVKEMSTRCLLIADVATRAARHHSTGGCGTGCVVMGMRSACA